MTLSDFTRERDLRPCGHCGNIGVTTEHNPNNNGLLVCCTACGSKRPWGSLLYLKHNEGKRKARPPLPEGQTLNSVWEKFANCCVICGAPKEFLIRLGIGRQVHHVLPYALEGHKGPLVSICSHCHAVANERQRLYWFFRRAVLGQEPEDVPTVHVQDGVTNSRAS